VAGHRNSCPQQQQRLFSGTLSVQDAAAKLYQQLMQPGSKLTWQGIAQLLCNTCSPSDQPRAYQASLAEALFSHLGALCTIDRTTGSGARFPAWLSGAVMQQQLYAVVQRHPDLAAVVLGPDAMEEAYIR
jgi:hypothetical protein